MTNKSNKHDDDAEQRDVFGKLVPNLMNRNHGDSRLFTVLASEMKRRPSCTGRVCGGEEDREVVALDEESKAMVLSLIHI